MKEGQVKPDIVPAKVHVVQWWVARVNGHAAGMITAPTQEIAEQVMKQQFLGQDRQLEAVHVEDATDAEVLRALAVGCMTAVTTIAQMADGIGRMLNMMSGGRGAKH